VSTASWHRNALLPLLAALVALAWLVLLRWPQAPHGRFAHYDAAIAGGLHTAPAAALIVAAWTLMIVAMMLPTSFPLLAIFHRLTRHRDDHALLVLLVVAGYLAVWALVGIAALAAGGALHAVADRSAWARANPAMIGAGILLGAGAYQFSPLKRACLAVCRTPISFLATHWLGRREPGQAFRLGARHGIFCVGCCWPLMLVMFVVGVGSLGWMLALGVIMAIEKNVPWGRRLSAPVGIALLCWGLAAGLRAALAA
jgi:predicted metal-binding membrane protein